jgi:hypothetical protein
MKEGKEIEWKWGGKTASSDNSVTVDVLRNISPSAVKTNVLPYRSVT